MCFDVNLFARVVVMPSNLSHSQLMLHTPEDNIVNCRTTYDGSLVGKGDFDENLWKGNSTVLYACKLLSSKNTFKYQITKQMYSTFQ